MTQTAYKKLIISGLFSTSILYISSCNWPYAFLSKHRASYHYRRKSPNRQMSSVIAQEHVDESRHIGNGNLLITVHIGTNGADFHVTA